MHDFHFHRPTSIAEARKLLQRSETAKLLGGGQSYLPVLKLDLAQPSDLISLVGVPELRGVQTDDTQVTIGASVTHAQVAAQVKDVLPSLAALASSIGDPQVRNRGTLGGSLAHADPAADYPAAVLALRATIKTDRRTIAADDFFTGLFETALEPDEVIVSCTFQRPRRAAYVKFRSHASRFALVGVMVAHFVDGVFVGVTGAGPKAFRFSTAEAALTARFDPESVADLVYPADDLTSTEEASAEYRAHLVSVMTARAVKRAC